MILNQPESVDDGEMKTILTTTQFETREQVKDFLSGTPDGRFSMPTKAARYEFLKTMLIRFKTTKQTKGVLLRFLSRVSGDSKGPIKRLVQPYLGTGKLPCKQGTAAPFTRKTTPADIGLLAPTDEWPETRSGPATRKRFERAYTVFDDLR
ncbi:MAG: hypothetical protein O7D86_03280 [Proteobacteria bacterium]|nr:hypothetical protein [Pseudomonadota bacterium]